MEYRLKTSNVVETFKHGEAADPQPNLYADANGLADDETTWESNRADASCAKRLRVWIHSREVWR